jgi:hypothetical protein
MIGGVSLLTQTPVGRRFFYKGRKHSDAEFNHGVCPDCLRKEMRRFV